MGLWNFLGSFALFNALCDLFSRKPKRYYTPAQRSYRDYDYEDYSSSNNDDAVDTSGIDDLKDRFDEFQDRIDCLEEWEDLQDELGDLRDELDDLEFDCDLYDDDHDW